jgi:hypothetical protein
MRRVRQAVSVLVLAALAVLGSAAVASAAFRATTNGTLSVTTFHLLPPKDLTATCSNRNPVVTFTPSTSIGDVPDHPGTKPPQVFGYTTNLVNSGGITTLGPQATKWSGQRQNRNTKLVFSIVTTYGSWKSDAASVTFTC